MRRISTITSDAFSFVESFLAGFAIGVILTLFIHGLEYV